MDLLRIVAYVEKKKKCPDRLFSLESERWVSRGSEQKQCEVPGYMIMGSEAMAGLS